MTNELFITIVYFIYGLAFFNMGMAITLERNRSNEPRLKYALFPLAMFGFLHGILEWLLMLEFMHGSEILSRIPNLWPNIKLGILGASFLSLILFGFSVIAENIPQRRINLLAPLGFAFVWAIGLIFIKGEYTIGFGLYTVSTVWTRYVLGIPSSIIAAVGLVSQQRRFRISGMERFGQDSLIAAVAFFWYGIVGQLFVENSRFFPSIYLNQETFQVWFGFPIQIFRALIAIVITVFVIRFMRAFDAEIKGQIRKLNEKSLREAKYRESILGEQLKRIVEAQESERERIARELHDETGQSLTAIGMGLSGANQLIPNNPTKAKSTIRQLGKLVSDSMLEIQRIIFNLRPSHLNDLGLSATLRWYLNRDKNQRKTKISFVESGKEPSIPVEIETTIFRIMQEAITNISKHAKAENAQVCICYLENRIILTVMDNGVGFDVRRINRKDVMTWGIIGIRERIAMLSGRFLFISEIGKGTFLEASVPINMKSDGVTQNRVEEYGNDYSDIDSRRSCSCEIRLANDSKS